MRRIAIRPASPSEDGNEYYDSTHAVKPHDVSFRACPLLFQSGTRTVVFDSLHADE
jgi:hypothetical protein